LHPVVSHASYLINLATIKASAWPALAAGLKCEIAALGSLRSSAT
jgi:hypothetical protein